MSIRIHKLAKELGLDNKEMMALLKERKIIAPDVKSVSSTVDNINASALRDEFSAKKGSSDTAVATATAPAATAVKADTSTGETPGGAAKEMHPAGAFVKSKQDIDREKEAVTAAKAAALKAATPAPAPAPVVAPKPV